MEGNYIKINRSLLRWEWYGDINTSRLFLHMLLKANWKDENYMGTTVPRGSFISSLPQLSKETNLSVRSVRTCLERLKTTGEVTVKSNNKYSVFTVNNYCTYQSSDRQNDTQSQVTGKRHAKRQANDMQNDRQNKTQATGKRADEENSENSVFTVNNCNPHKLQGGQDDTQDGIEATGKCGEKRQARSAKNDTPIIKRSKEGEEVNNINNNIQSTSYSCQEQFKFILKDGSYYEVPAEDLEKYKKTFPLVDVESELRIMECWCEVNKAKRKTRRGAGRFIVNWLTRKQEEQSQRGAARRQASKSALEAWANEEE